MPHPHHRHDPDEDERRLARLEDDQDEATEAECRRDRADERAPHPARQAASHRLARAERRGRFGPGDDGPRAA